MVESKVIPELVVGVIESVSGAVPPLPEYAIEERAIPVVVVIALDCDEPIPELIEATSAVLNARP